MRAGGANPDAGKADVERLSEGQALIAFLDPLSNPDTQNLLAKRGVSAFSMELMPRITRAQSMDALSAMATIAGYKAVLLAANTLPRMFPMMMTAAGTIAPARAFVIGAGVAGLQAIASARRLGAVVRAYDVRPAVADQVRSVGGEFVELPLEAGDAEDKGGYARAQDETFYRRQRELMGRLVGDSDVVITTAAIPGKPAPVLITRDMVRGMTPGSVIVDLAAERGGNCELTRADETVVAHGVTILGPSNLPSTVPFHASQLYAKNLATFLKHLMKDGALNDRCRGRDHARDAHHSRRRSGPCADPGAPGRTRAESGGSREGLGGASLGDTGMDLLVVSITIFVLAIFVGFEVIAKVPPTLHTPLMSGSNAISGITVIGAILSGGNAAHRADEVARICRPWFLRRSTSWAASWSPTACSACSAANSVMATALVNLAYLTASVLFILGLKGLSHPRTAVRGNLLGAIGMLLAIAVTLLDRNILSYEWIAGGAALGTVIGALLAQRIRITAMPQLVALLNGFGGIASVLVAGAALHEAHLGTTLAEPHSGTALQYSISVALSGLIGAVTFWGSLIAFVKLEELIGWKTMAALESLPGANYFTTTC